MKTKKKVNLPCYFFARSNPYTPVFPNFFLLKYSPFLLFLLNHSRPPFTLFISPFTFLLSTFAFSIIFSHFLFPVFIFPFPTPSIYPSIPSAALLPNCRVLSLCLFFLLLPTSKGLHVLSYVFTI